MRFWPACFCFILLAALSLPGNVLAQSMNVDGSINFGSGVSDDWIPETDPPSGTGPLSFSVSPIFGNVTLEGSFMELWAGAVGFSLLDGSQAPASPPLRSLAYGNVVSDPYHQNFENDALACCTNSASGSGTPSTGVATRMRFQPFEGFGSYPRGYLATCFSSAGNTTKAFISIRNSGSSLVSGQCLKKWTDYQ